MKIKSPQQKTGAGFNRHNSKQDYSTPKDFLDAVRMRFGELCWDLAANDKNHKAPNWISCDSLNKTWLLTGLLWLNPPFNDIAPWAEKCAKESKIGARILFLVPASVGSNWFADYVYGKALVLALNPRLSFDGKNAYPKDLILACYGFGVGFDVWRWK